MTDHQVQRLIIGVMMAGLLAGGHIKMGRDSNGRIVFTPPLEEARRIIQDATVILSRE